MRAEKQNITKEYLTRLNGSPFFLVVDYTGLKVGPITELRKRLHKAGAEIHVVKNSIFRMAAKEAGMADLSGSLTGQLAVITGQKDVSSAAKIVKTFGAEFEKPKIKFGYLNNQRLESKDILALADLPSIEVLRGRLLGVINAPATKLAALINTPGGMLARVIQAKVDKGE
ncbi:MAG: beta-defensin antibiotic precursor antimicrobial defensin beta signal defensin bd-32 defb-32 [Verrucomicrobiales bacterium]|jgi:large subunit ribosomal protein L10|nr:beta-defensin antibiotic precursor antimicrobial defensin beta signal defensin bd-32 defb-32 [Verrucomicrobiales bacterium]MDB6131384.1 beta-defensin antibiotic precursor antimicrobial defensin beta signal defensin bd-32 defb-32 [Verrucomicrobiales bacterium]